MIPYMPLAPNSSAHQSANLPELPRRLSPCRFSSTKATSIITMAALRMGLSFPPRNSTSCSSGSTMPPKSEQIIWKA